MTAAVLANNVPLLEICGVTKRYPGVLAVDDVSVSLGAGQIIGLVGKNGAGKSTLIKIMAGAERANEGHLRLNGTPLDLHHPHDATVAGLAFVHQDLQDVGDLSVAENVMLGLGYPRKFGLLVDWAELYSRAAEPIARLEVDIDPRRAVGELSVAQQRLVMIARGLAQQARLLVLDEPSASLTDEEIEHLFTVVRRLRDEGITVVYVSHRLEEIFELTERVIVMRNGRLVADEPTESLDRGSLIAHITGHEHARTATERRANRKVGGRPDTEVVLEVHRLSADTGVHDCSFDVRKGEILGLGGLVGSGRTELVRAVFGADHRQGGTVRVHGTEVAGNNPSKSMSSGLALLPEDRKTQGNIMDFSVRNNITLASLDRHRIRRQAPVPSSRSEKQAAGSRIGRLSIATPSDRQLVRLLSGGNQQKVVIAKWLEQGADVLIFDEPTIGVDVDGKEEIYDIMEELAAEGKAVVFISSEFSELVGVCHRVLVLGEGRIVGELEGDAVTEPAIVEACYSQR
ncbi:sugar ABC transporter ATP-binding protein [Candidatus Poriferisocius sp.]|uniref:sugar ABC transporter ATP-binding protein n=1 Tax=Candidatus Poriferisocius sp. TaxID=3101276 RepID=UPI003B02A5B1